MRLDLSEDEQFFQETVRRFVETEMPTSTVRGLLDTAAGYDPSWCKSGAELGFTSFLVPEELGGGSLTDRPVADLAIVAEELGRGIAPGPFVPTNIVAETISRVGSSAQRELLAGVVAGELVLAWAFCEPNADWTAGAIELAAIATNDGYEITGLKTAVESGAQADHILVTARCDGALAQFLVPASAEGLTVTAQKSLDLSRRFAEVRFDGVTVGPEAMVGDPATTSVDVERQRQLALVLQCADTNGVTGRVHEFTVEYAFDRHSFGRPLASYQALKHRFADTKTWLEASYATADAAAVALSRSGDATEVVEVASAYVGEHAIEIIQDCVQLHGGIGVTWEHDIHLFLRRATVNRGLFGAPSQNRQRIAIAAGV
jgi:alkylation response protein AidB-like acyl-CoA dehydrogenase